MAGAVKQALDDFHTITPHLVVRDAPRAIEFYCKAFGAAELYRNAAPDGKSIMHAELLLGNSRFLLHDEFPDRGMLSPLAYNGTSTTLHLYVDNVDVIFNRAIELGAEVLMPLADQFWGDRYGILKDPFGHRWSIATKIQDFSPKELQAQADKFKAENKDWPRE